jgi:general secretion pathway protein D
MKKNNILFLMIIVCSFSLISPCSIAEQQGNKENMFLGTLIPDNLPPMNIDFVEQDLVKIIETIAATLKINILFPQGNDEIKQKITFKQQKNPITFKEGIRLIETFLGWTGYALVSKSKNLYSIIKLNDQYQINESLPLYVNVSVDDLPFTDAPIRAIFYLSNLKVSSSDSLKKVLDEMLTSEKSYAFDPQTNGIIITDKANLISAAMKFIGELDQMGSQTRVEFIQLYNALATDLVELIKKQIIGISDNPTPFLFNEAKTESAVFFPKSLRLAAEPRTNSIVVMGKQGAVERMQEFVRNVLDLPIDAGQSILHVYDLQYLIAVDLEAVLKSVFTNTSGDQSTNQAMNEIFRGVQIFAERPVEQTAEQSTSGTANVNAGSQLAQNISRGGNRILVAALDSDWKRIKKFLDDIDKPQDQVILEALLIDVETSQLKELGSQVRSSNNDRFGQTAGSFQSAQLANMITEPYAPSSTPTLEADLLAKIYQTSSGSESLAAYLTNLGTGDPGSLILSLGSNSPEAGSVSAVMKILDSITNAKILSHPFVVTSNNQTATMVVKSIRRGAADASVVASGGAINIAQVDIEANLTLTAVPRVSSKDRLNLTLKITAEQFDSAVGDGSEASLTKNNRIVETNANIGTGDILVLGGLGRDAINNSEYRWPILSKIPLVGWLFKSRTESIIHSSLIVFIVPTIVHAHLPDGMDRFTLSKIKEGEQQLDYNSTSDNRDPITRLFFKKRSYTEKELINYVKSRQQIQDEAQQYQVLEKNKQALHMLQKNIAEEENPLVKKK